jgi:hypothetical protein
MKHRFASVVAFTLAATTAQAHFVWIVPDKEGATAQVVFSEIPEPDSPKFLDKIAKTQLYLRHADNREVPLKWTRGKEAYQVALPGEGPRTVGGVCCYGVTQRGDSDPFLLMYYAKAHLARETGRKPLPSTAWERLPLEIVQAKGNDLERFQVLWQGKPVAGAEVVFLPPGQDKLEKRTTDKAGMFDLGSFKAGVYGIRARHVEDKDGEHEGKKYKEVRHYTTLVVQVAEGQPSQVPAEGPKQVVGAKADPQAGKLLAHARAARARWEDFPGFTADVEINLDGTVSRGKVKVNAAGQVSFDELDNEPGAWAKRVLGSVVAHRLDNSEERDTPCAFADGEENHPLGRAITVLNDELHSSYRVRDRQIVVVNRQTKTSRFSITVLENRTNKEGKFLPTSFVVHHWDARTGELQKTEANSQSWTRVGPFDLPLTARVITATRGLSARSLTLSNHKLSETKANK